jgi:hypothetical protein
VVVSGTLLMQTNIFIVSMFLRKNRQFLSNKK